MPPGLLFIIMWVHSFCGYIAFCLTYFLTYPKLGADVRTGYSASEFSIEPAGYSGYVVRLTTLSGLLAST